MNFTKIWHRNFLQFRRSWVINFLWIVLEPIFFLIGVGYGLGAFINNIDGVSYTDFYFPALLAVSTMMISYFESTYGCYTKLFYQKLYKTMLMTPLTSRDIVFGEAMWSASKGMLSAFGVSIVFFSFGHLGTWKIVPAFLILFLTGFLFSCFGLIVTALVRNYDSIIYPTSGFIIPMSIFCGTFFSLNQFPVWLKGITYLFPLTHSVAATRKLLLLNSIPWTFWAHLGYLVLLSGILFYWALKLLNRKLYV